MTFSLVIKPTTIRLVLHLVVSHGWAIHRLDVNNAFLHGTISGNVYMSRPPGVVDPNLPSHVCRVRKALYHLKEAPQAWYTKLSSVLLSHSLTNVASDASLFISKLGSDVLYSLVHVDDRIIIDNNSSFFM